MILFLNCIILEGRKYLKTNFLVIYSHVVIELGVRELNLSLVAPFREKENNFNLIAPQSSVIAYIDQKLLQSSANASVGSPLDSPLKCLPNYNIWNITCFSSKLFAKICGHTMLRLKFSNYGRRNSVNDMLLLSSH